MSCPVCLFSGGFNFGNFLFHNFHGDLISRFWHFTIFANTALHYLTIIAAKKINKFCAHVLWLVALKFDSVILV